MITKKQTVQKMVESLRRYAAENNKSLTGITILDFNTFLDDLFEDGGETRCERFVDLAWEYAGQFGPLDSDGFNRAQWECIKKAVHELEKGE